MSLDAVCFDLDDTLYSYSQYARTGLYRAARHLEEKTGEKLYDELFSLYFVDGITSETFDVLIERHDLASSLVPELIETYHSASTPLVPYPETEPLLSYLSDQYKLGLITDGREGRMKLNRLGLTRYFDVVTVTPESNRSKHEQIVFEQTLGDLGVTPDSAMYVGDDPRVDFRIPNQLGMCTVRLLRGRYKQLLMTEDTARADHSIHSLKSLIRLADTDVRDYTGGRKFPDSRPSV